MKTNKTQIRNFELIILTSWVVIIGLFISLNYSQAKLGNYIYSQTAEPFLEQSLLNNRNLKNLTKYPKSAEFSKLTQAQH